MIARGAALVALIIMPGLVAAAESHHALTRADRLEYQSEEDVAVWELQGWYGGDLHKFWWKAEGDAGAGASDEFSFQLLYSRAVSPYVDVQMGIAFEDHISDEDLALVVGIEGLMPYNVEIDASAFLTDHGDLLFRGEVEREIQLSQRVVLLPRARLHAALSDVSDQPTERGVNDMAIELRLGYKAHHKFVPYLGVSWQRTFGGAGRALRDAGEDDAFTSLVAGARFWF